MKSPVVRSKGGFTLIELLVSMAVLSVMVVLLATMMDQASKAWTRGERQVITYDLGRSALEELQRDTAASVADDLLPFKVKNLFAVDIGGPTRVQTGFGGPGLYVGTNDFVRMVSAMAPRTEGDEDNDFLDIAYFVQIDADDRGRLLRRAANINFQGKTEAPRFGVSEYTTRSLAAEDELWRQQVFLDPDADTEVIVENVYSFEAIAYDENLNDIPDYYSKREGNRGPARLDYRLTVLTDAQWTRKDTFTDVADWHRYAERNGQRFVTSAAQMTRGR